MIFYFHIQSNHLKYTILPIPIAKLPELYILTDSGIKAGKRRNKKKYEMRRQELLQALPNSCLYTLSTKKSFGALLNRGE